MRNILITCMVIIFGSFGAIHGVQAEESKMFKMTIMYPYSEDAVFDMDYYLNKHMPLSLKRQGEAVKSVLIEKGYDPGIPGIQFAYVVICHFTYDTQQAFLDAFLPHAEELQGDIPNYTSVQPVIQFSTIEMEQ